MGIEAWDAWADHVGSGDDAKRLQAVRERREIACVTGDTLATNPMSVARLLVSLSARLDELERRIGSDGDGPLFWLQESVESMREREW
jgi:hypothetical protein